MRIPAKCPVAIAVIPGDIGYDGDVQGFGGPRPCIRLLGKEE